MDLQKNQYSVEFWFSGLWFGFFACSSLFFTHPLSACTSDLCFPLLLRIPVSMSREENSPFCPSALCITNWILYKDRKLSISIGVFSLTANVCFSSERQNCACTIICKLDLLSGHSTVVPKISTKRYKGLIFIMILIMITSHDACALATRIDPFASEKHNHSKHCLRPFSPRQ